LFFFFQAEDGIRYFHVTGVQTCALPISVGGGGVARGVTAAFRQGGRRFPGRRWVPHRVGTAGRGPAGPALSCLPGHSPEPAMLRSEGRRVGTERRSTVLNYHIRSNEFKQ